MVEKNYLFPTANRGDKDPYKLSDRIKLYGNSYEVYDLDNYENCYVCCKNCVMDKIIELKGAQVEEGIIKGPAAKIGQLCQLYFSVYPCYLSYCLVYNNGAPFYNYVSVPANYAAVLRSKRNKAKQFSEKEFAMEEFGYGGEVSEEVLSSEKIKLKGAQLVVPDSSITVPAFPYGSFLAIEEQVKKERTSKTEGKFNFYDKGMAQLLECDKIYSIWTEIQAEGIEFLETL